MVKKVLNSTESNKSLSHTEIDNESPFEAIYYDIPVVMTVEQAAKILGIGRTTTFGLIKAGKIKTFLNGRRLRISRASLISYIESISGPEELD